MTSMRDNRANVYEIQTYLRAIQMARGDKTLINPDGVFGKETEEAVKNFQRENNIIPTGRVNEETWNKLYAKYLLILKAAAPAAAVRIFPQEAVEFKIGDTSDEIYVLQVVLRRLDEELNRPENVTVSGTFDRETEIAVKNLQRLFDVPRTGIVDKALWNKFVEFNNVRHLYR